MCEWSYSGTKRPACGDRRAPYFRPSLRRFGRVAEQTKRVATNPAALRDKPGGGTNKTR